MKFLTLFSLMVCLKYTMQQPSAAESLLEMAKSSVIDCYEDEAEMKKIEITETGFHDLLTGSRDATRNAKCIRYCIMKKHNLFSADNQLDAKEVVPFFTYLFGSTIEVEHLTRITDKCNDVIFGQLDRCERSHMATMCILQQLKEGGLKDV